jgi:uncharacterized membrane protein YdcZ (DUF606 family)
VVEHYGHVVKDGALLYDWRSIWIWAGGLSAVVLVGFLFSFSDKEGTTESIVRPVAGKELPGALI